MNECYAFECWLKDEPTWIKVINARTRGKAKVQYFRDVSDSWEIDYKDIRSRKIGNPITSERFIHNAKYRGMSDVRCVYVVANCGFDNLDDAWHFKEKMGFPDSVCSGNMFYDLKK